MATQMRLFLGLDSSTQGLKAVAVDETLKIVYERGVQYDDDLPFYKTRGGVRHGADGLTVTAPTLMWVEALDLLFARMRDDHFPFAAVAAVSASGQQHGGVFWKRGARRLLGGLIPNRPLSAQLATAFAVEESPVWMDSSTTAECRAREAALGGAQAVADVTGSRAYERFTGNQIAKVARLQPTAYAATERIGLVSSFIVTLLAGDYAPIDWSDGSGMNLLDIRTKAWDPRSLEVTAPDLLRRLGAPVASHSVVGFISPALAGTFGWAKECRVIAASGDNPCSLAGLVLRKPGDIAISLGTSDTVFGTLSEPHPSGREGHVFVNPVDPGGYMAMICYKNGSLTREAIRRQVGAASWDAFGERVARTPPGNGGRIGFYMLEPEITPPILKTGIFRFGADAATAGGFAPEAEARAVLEGQFLSMRLHADAVGIRPAGILATGGASVDPAVLRIMCDVFGVPVSRGDVPNSAAVGAAYRALHGWQCAERRGFVSFADVIPAAPGVVKAMDPDPEAHAVYTGMLPRYAELEKQVMG
ncbi:MAG: xylulokinase [Kiritimatiellia bacterium]